MLFIYYLSLYKKLKLYEYVDPGQIRELRPAIEYCRKSIALRESLAGEVHKVRISVGGNTICDPLPQNQEQVLFYIN